MMRRVQILYTCAARLCQSGTANCCCRAIGRIAEVGTTLVADHAAVIGNVVDHFGARGVETGAAACDLVIVEQLVLLRIVRVRDRRQQVGEVHRQAAACDRTHHQRTGTLVGAQLDVTSGALCL